MNKLKRWFRRATIVLPVMFLISAGFLANYQIKRAYADDPVIDWEVTPRGNYKGMYIAPDPAATFPISGTITATIEGGSTETTQLLVKQLLQDLKDGKATETTLAALLLQLQKQKFTGNDLNVIMSNTAFTANAGTNLNTSALSLEATQLLIKAVMDNFKWNGQMLKVDGSGVTQPMSVVSLPLPTGAALDATLTGGTQKSQIIDGSGNVIGSTGNALDINIKSGNPTSLTANAGTGWGDSGLAKETGGNLATVKTNTDPLVTAGGGGYIRQDSTSTIAKESGGNLADIKTAVEAYTYTPVFAISTLADTAVWYAYSIPADTVELSITARTGYDWKVSMDNDGATYEKIWAGDSFKIGHVRNTKVTGTLYFNSPDEAGLVLQVRYLTEN